VKRIDLETYLCDVQRKLKETEVFRNQKQVSMHHAFEDMEERRVEWALHDTNMKFMMSKDARSIDMKEYVGVRELLTKTSEAYSEAATKARNLSAVVVQFNKTMSDCRVEIERVNKLLEKCGAVIQGPWKKVE
jgi:hypothetical protein